MTTTNDSGAIKIERIEPDAHQVQEGEITLRITMPASKQQKLFDFMTSDTWEQAQAVRADNIENWTGSLEIAVNWALRHDNSGARVFASLLASMYNGNRVKFDASDLKLLDGANFEHAINCMRLCQETCREPHQFFKNGGQLFERMIEQWGFEKKTRRARS